MVGARPTRRQQPPDAPSVARCLEARNATNSRSATVEKVCRRKAFRFLKAKGRASCSPRRNKGARGTGKNQHRKVRSHAGTAPPKLSDLGVTNATSGQSAARGLRELSRRAVRAADLCIHGWARLALLYPEPDKGGRGHKKSAARAAGTSEDTKGVPPSSRKAAAKD
jgi:hypothetical protein